MADKNVRRSEAGVIKFLSSKLDGKGWAAMEQTLPIHGKLVLQSLSSYVDSKMKGTGQAIIRVDVRKVLGDRFYMKEYIRGKLVQRGIVDKISHVVEHQEKPG